MGKNLSLSCFQTYMNHAGDKDLKELIHDLMDQTKQEIDECNELLKQNEIAPPPAFPEKPSANREDIPIGARFADPEIFANIYADLAASLVLCSQIMAKCIREDVGAMFEKYHTKKTAISLRALRLTKDKGWLMPPPLHVERAEPVTV